MVEEKKMYDAAFERALGGGVLIQEAAEIDDETFILNITRLSDVPEQVIVNTCNFHAVPLKIFEQWKVIELRGDR